MSVVITIWCSRPYWSALGGRRVVWQLMVGMSRDALLVIAWALIIAVIGLLLLAIYLLVWGSIAAPLFYYSYFRQNSAKAVTAWVRVGMGSILKAMRTHPGEPKASPGIKAIPLVSNNLAQNSIELVVIC